MSEAASTIIRKASNSPTPARRAEVNTGDFPVGQKDSILLPADGMPNREEIAIAPAMDGGKHLSKYMSDIAFGEDPIEIRIEPGQGRFAPKIIDCWVNGKGAEQFVNGKWDIKGWLPVGVSCVTRRKYVEVLLRSKMDNVSTRTTRHEDHEDNFVDRQTSSASPLTIISDPSPAGRDWIEKILREG